MGTGGQTNAQLSKRGRKSESYRREHDDEAVDEIEEGKDVQAAAAAVSGAAPRTAATEAQGRGKAPACRHPPFPVALSLVAAGAVSTALYFLLRRWRRRGIGGSGAVQRPSVSRQQVYSAVLALHEPSAQLPLPSSAAGALAGRTLVLSDRLDVQALETRFGCEVWKAERSPAATTYWPTDALVAAGAAGVATVFSEPLGLGPLLSLSSAGTPNPAGRGRTHGGGDYGAAVAVAAGLADLALAVDELGSAQVPAACCGAYALRCTAGVLPAEGAAVASASLASPALLAGDAGVLLKAGTALRLPGGGAATEVPNYLVAEDFFAACGEEAKRMVPAVVAAVKRWAGPDQAQAVSLCQWLYHRVASLAAFMPSAAEQQQQQTAAAANQQRSEGILQALAAAAEALRCFEFVQRCGAWVQERQAELPAEVVHWWRQAQQVDKAQYQQAREVADELQAAMRDALKDGYIFVLPTTPGPAPPVVPGSGDGSEAAEQDGAAFRARCLQFAAVASLSGAPTVALPLPVPGAMPLGVSLLALHKRDMALLQAAAKLGPILAEEAAALAEQHKEAARQKAEPQQWRPAAAAAEQAGGSGGGSGAPPGSAQRGSGSSKGRGGGPGGSAGLSEQAAAALARKEEGNRAFKEGRYEEAVRQYSAAVQLDPREAVFYSNRAMAYLKLGAYGDAEADCDAALKLELSSKALLRRASARLAQGNVAGAKADFRQVLALEPNNRQAREELARMQALQGPDGEGGEGGLGSGVHATLF